MDAFRRTFSQGIRAVFFVMVPSAAGLAVLRVPLVRLLFQTGEFGAADCAAYPFLRYAVGIDQDDPWTFHRVINERMPLQPRHENLRAWIARMRERPMA